MSTLPGDARARLQPAGDWRRPNRRAGGPATHLVAGSYLSGHPNEVVLNAHWAATTDSRSGMRCCSRETCAKALPTCRSSGCSMTWASERLARGRSPSFREARWPRRSPGLARRRAARPSHRSIWSFPSPPSGGAPRAGHLTQRAVRGRDGVDAASQLARAQNGFAGIAFLFGLVALAVGGFLVANTMVMTLSERTREVGLLRAAGTTARQVLRDLRPPGSRPRTRRLDPGSACWGSPSRRG